MEEVCRHRFGEMPVAMFRLFTCSLCYQFLFHGRIHLKPDPQDLGRLVTVDGIDMFPENYSIAADVANVTSREIICGTLGGDADCERWMECCFSAIACCERQVSVPKLNVSSELYCSRTWDGFGCLDDTNSSSRAYIQCPAYVEHASISEKAYIDCTENGTWWVNPVTGMEWTNYTTCVRKEDFQTMTRVALFCNVISLILSMLACAIFIIIRQLRVQNRIRLHVFLFLSFILTSCATIMWDKIVYVDRLEHSKENTIMHGNSGGCKFLYILTRYSSTSNFFWMFCEGLFLHRLLAHTFSPPNSLVPYCVFGWVGAWIPIVIYSTLRATSLKYNTECWVHTADLLEWIMYTPNLLCLVINLVFLFDILRILSTKLQAHPNEPSHYRRALKAAFFLIPLFGITQILIIYRPTPGTASAFNYEIASTVINNTQGAVVAVIYCFINKEMHTNLSSYFKQRMHFRHKFSHRDGSTQAMIISSVHSHERDTRLHESSGRGYIPVSVSSKANDISNTSQINGIANV